MVDLLCLRALHAPPFIGGHGGTATGLPRACPAASQRLWRWRTQQPQQQQQQRGRFPSLLVAGAAGKRRKSAGAAPPPPISAPSLTELKEDVVPVDAPPPIPSRKAAAAGNSGALGRNTFVQLIWRSVLRRLSSLPLAIGELLVIAALSAVGTIIEQNESPQFYFDSYPEENPMFGFLSWRVILDGSLDHIYTSWYFLGLLFLLAASLAACTTTRQFPIVRVAKRWSFLKSPASIEKLPVSDTLERAKLGDLATLLMAEGFQIFVKGPALYAFRGLAGRYAPIGVHAAMLLIMGGATISAFGGYQGSVMVPQGLRFQVGDILSSRGFLSVPSPVMNLQINVNKFFIDYLPTGAVSQFHSDISVLDLRDKEEYGKTISVNDPLRYHGLTMYQTDWGISAIQLRVDGSDPFNLVMAALESGDKKLFGTFLPLGEEGLEKAKGISILARDLQSVVIYDQEGKFVGVRRPGSGKPIAVDGVSIIVDDLIGSSGLELKMDPGVPVVYAGFGALMLTTVISYLSHSQVWALQNGTRLVVGGKSNRAKMDFEAQLNKILDLVPDVRPVPEENRQIPTSVSAGNVDWSQVPPEEEGPSGEEDVKEGKVLQRPPEVVMK